MSQKKLLLLHFVCLFSLIGQTSFAQNQDDLLLRRWKMTEIITQKMLNYSEQIIENTDLLGKPKPQEIIDEENMVQNLIDKGSYIDIKKGNVFIMGLYNFVADEILPIKTRWYYLDDNKAFNIAPEKVTKTVKNKKGVKITATNSMDYTKYRILELSATVLKLRVEKAGETEPNTIIVFSPMQ
jgi:hypothetical protein